MTRKPVSLKRALLVVFTTTTTLISITALCLILMFAVTYYRATLEPALSVFSPNRMYEAYVVNELSIDPPHQTVYIQHSDETRFIFVAHLAEDVDSVQKIVWSPASDLAIIVTSNNLFAVLVPGFQSLRIPLDSEFARYSPGKGSTFGGGIPQYRVSEITFPEQGVFAYRLSKIKGMTATGPIPLHVVRLAEMIGQ